MPALGGDAPRLGALGGRMAHHRDRLRELIWTPIPAIRSSLTRHSA
jgi:hypothetical protein